MLSIRVAKVEVIQVGFVILRYNEYEDMIFKNSFVSVRTSSFSKLKSPIRYTSLSLCITLKSKMFIKSLNSCTS